MANSYKRNTHNSNKSSFNLNKSNLNKSNLNKSNSNKSHFSSILVNDSINHDKVFEELKNIKKMLKEYHEEISALRNENQKLQKEVGILNVKVGLLEQERLVNSVDIIGMPSVNKENLKSGVIDIIKERLDINLAISDITHCYAKKVFNKKISTSDNISQTKKHHQNNPIVCVKFFSQTTKLNIMKKLKEQTKQKALNSDIDGSERETKRLFINDSLSKYTRAVFNAAKIIKVEKNYEYLWVKNGKIFMRKEEGNNYVRIYSIEDLNNL